MNEQNTPAQFAYPPDQRRKWIRHLARRGDHEAIEELRYLAAHDPVLALRQLAQKGLRYIRFQQQLHSPYHPQAEKHLLAAYRHQLNGQRAEAIQYLSKAIFTDARLCEDQAVQQLADELIGVENSIHQITTPAQLNQIIEAISAPAKVVHSVNIPGALITLVFVCVYFVGYVLANYESSYSVIGQLHISQYRTEIRRLSPEINYHLFYTDGAVPSGGYSVLVLLHEDGAEPDHLMRLFAQSARQNRLIIVAPEFNEYRYPYEQEVLPHLDKIITQVSETFPVNTSGAVLFGFKEGGEIATLYAQEYPNKLAGLVASSAPYIYPSPHPDLPFEIVYGYDDPLLPHYHDDEVVFTDMTQWDFPMNYLVVEGIGREVEQQQINLTVEMIDAVAIR